MDPINFFSVASQQNRWLAVRQSVVAQNIANANTPGFKALDVEPFEAVLNATGLQLNTTQARHLSPTAATGKTAETSEQKPTWDIVHSGNSVNLEEQLLKAGEISGQFARNAGVLKTFHRMILASARG